MRNEIEKNNFPDEEFGQITKTVGSQVSPKENDVITSPEQKAMSTVEQIKQSKNTTKVLMT